MIATSLEFAGRTAENKNKWIATISSETTPAELTITGADVENMTDGDILAAGSVIITPSENFYAFEDGTFTQKS